MLRETLAKGGRYYRPRIAHPNLAAAFVDPALKFLEGTGAPVRLGARVRGLPRDERSVLAIETTEATLPVGSQDAVILAVPPWVATDLLPGLARARCISAPSSTPISVSTRLQVRPPCSG